ncbi:MAG: sodium:solute symporter [Phocaeicola sp.]|nr:sodium:solute symporter [Phocaeicola sp.]MDY5939141.1 sodium:solute symporter [Phocaeicola sp.]
MNGIFILVTIVIYFGLLLLISHFTSGSNADNDTFFRGNRQSPWYIVSFGMIGATLSGVTFVSVPGMVSGIDMTYMQTCLGFFVGYLFIAHILLPLYYRLQLTSIYTYLGKRLGRRSYKTGASFFLLSKMLGASARLYLVCLILQEYVFAQYHIPFTITAIGTVVLIWLYTRKGGIKTIVWTDSLQTFCLLAALLLIVWNVSSLLNLDFSGVVDTITGSEHSKIFVFDDWQSKQNFFKQFFSGIFITIVMTGLDQDMMQKNLSCKNLKEARRNMYCYGFSFVPVNLIFLSLGILLLVLAQKMQIVLPDNGDQILPLFAANGYLGYAVLVFFTIGIIAAAFSSADSALAALTTSCCIDILEIEKKTAAEATRLRKRTHFFISTLFILCILAFEALNNKSVIDTIYILASYTYGPLLGLFTYGLFTKRATRDKLVPYIAVASPIVCYFIDKGVYAATGYKFGYEMLMFNGLLTFFCLYIASIGTVPTTQIEQDGN